MQKFAGFARPLFSTRGISCVPEFKPRVVMKLNIVLYAVRFARSRTEASGAFLARENHPLAHQRPTSGFLP
jgi:hypothetical protein